VKLGWRVVVEPHENGRVCISARNPIRSIWETDPYVWIYPCWILNFLNLALNNIWCLSFCSFQTRVVRAIKKMERFCARKNEMLDWKERYEKQLDDAGYGEREKKPKDDAPILIGTSQYIFPTGAKPPVTQPRPDIAPRATPRGGSGKSNLPTVIISVDPKAKQKDIEKFVNEIKERLNAD